MSWVEAICSGCGAANVVRWFDADWDGAGYAERPDCSECGAELDFTDSEPADPLDFEPDPYDRATDR